MYALDGVSITHAETDEEILECFDVMRQLYPQLFTAAQMLSALSRRRAQDYHLIVMRHGSKPIGLAGYRRIARMFAEYDLLFVDDFVVDRAYHGQQLSGALLAKLCAIGRILRCNRLGINAPLDDQLALSLFTEKGMSAEAMYLTLDL